MKLQEYELVLIILLCAGWAWMITHNKEGYSFGYKPNSNQGPKYINAAQFAVTSTATPNVAELYGTKQNTCSYPLPVPNLERFTSPPPKVKNVNHSKISHFGFGINEIPENMGYPVDSRPGDIPPLNWDVSITPTKPLMTDYNVAVPQTAREYTPKPFTLPLNDYVRTDEWQRRLGMLDGQPTIFL